MKLTKSFTTVTTFSKLLAMFLFILFPFVGFLAGMKYQEKLTPRPQVYVNNPSPVPSTSFPTLSPKLSCTPRPACLDATPRCMIPETSDMCPPRKPTGIKACPMLAFKNSKGQTCAYSGPNCEVECN